MSQAGDLSAHGTDTAVFGSLDLPLQRRRDRTAVNYDASFTMLSVILIRALIYGIGAVSMMTLNLGGHIDMKVASGSSWIAFDSNAYRDILLNGYPQGPTVPYQIGYFPLFPLVSRLFLPVCSAVVGPDAAPRAAMLLVSNVCSVIGLYFVYEWACLFLKRRTAYLTTIILAFYPGAVFFSAGLTEGPFLMLVAIALYLLGKQRLYGAAIVSAFATLCRPTGVALALTVVAWSFYYSRHLGKSQLLFKIALIAVVSAAGAISYECFLWHRYQRYDAYQVSEDFWDPQSHPSGNVADVKQFTAVEHNAAEAGNAVTGADVGTFFSTPSPSDPPRYSLQFFIDRLWTTQAWNRMIALGLIILSIAAFFRPRDISRILLILPLTIFVISYLPNHGLRASSIFRYETASLPLFAIMAIWLSKPSRKPLLFALIGLSLGLQLYYAFRFSRGLWVG